MILDKTWAAKVFTPEQLKKFGVVASSLSQEEKAQYSKDWYALIAEIQPHVSEDPYGEKGQYYTKKWMDLVYRVWTDSELGPAIWEAYKKDQIPKDEPIMGMPGIPQEVILWIDKAAFFMYSGKKK